MKRFILALILTISTMTAIGQSRPIAHTPWIIENAGDWGSFQWQVLRQDINPNYHHYMVFAYSNSYLRGYNGQVQPAITFAKDVVVCMVENNKYGVPYNQVDVYLTKMICDHNGTKMIANFYSNSPYNTFRISYSKISPWDLNSNY